MFLNWSTSNVATSTASFTSATTVLPNSTVASIASPTLSVTSSTPSTTLPTASAATLPASLNLPENKSPIALPSLGTNSNRPSNLLNRFSFSRSTKFIKASLGLVKANTIFSPNCAKKSIILPVMIPRASIAMASLRLPSSEFLKCENSAVSAINRAPSPVAAIAPFSPLKPAVAPLMPAFISAKACLPFASIEFSSATFLVSLPRFFISFCSSSTDLTSFSIPSMVNVILTSCSAIST